MSKNYYAEIYLHLVWHTKLSMPLITDALEPFVESALREKAAELGNIYLHDIGGTPTHVHVAMNIEPTVTISDLVGLLKGYSSHEVNRRAGLGRKLLEWQAGYGVVSFGKMDLPWVAGYIRNQKEHHARGKVQERLEIITHDENEG